MTRAVFYDTNSVPLTTQSTGTFYADDRGTGNGKAAIQVYGSASFSVQLYATILNDEQYVAIGSAITTSGLTYFPRITDAKYKLVVASNTGTLDVILSDGSSSSIVISNPNTSLPISIVSKIIASDGLVVNPEATAAHSYTYDTSNNLLTDTYVDLNTNTYRQTLTWTNGTLTSTSNWVKQ